MRGKCSLSILVVCGIALAAFLLTGQARLLGEKAGEEVAAIPAAADSYVYRLELNGMPVETYTECSGLGSSSDIEEQKTLNEMRVLTWRATPGALRWDSITLKRDSLSNGQIWQWRKSIEQGRLPDAFKNGSIVMLGWSSSQEYARWSFRNGWPARLSFSGGVEELVIVHDGLEAMIPGTGSSTTTTKKR